MVRVLVETVISVLRLLLKGAAAHKRVPGLVEHTQAMVGVPAAMAACTLAVLPLVPVGVELAVTQVMGATAELH